MLCSILVMERLYGVPLTDLAAIRSMTTADPELTLIRALNTWFGSVMGAETFHADVPAGEQPENFLGRALAFATRPCYAAVCFLCNNCCLQCRQSPCAQRWTHWFHCKWPRPACPLIKYSGLKSACDCRILALLAPSIQSPGLLLNLF